MIINNIFNLLNNINNKKKIIIDFDNTKNKKLIF